MVRCCDNRTFETFEEREMLRSDLDFFIISPEKKGEKLGELSLYHSIYSQQ